MNDLYGIFKKNSSDNHYVSFAKSLNSAYTSKYTRESMKSIEKYCSHGANILINNGVCYVSYIRNTAENNDDELSPTLELLLVTFSLERALCDDFDPDTEIKRIIIGRMGDELLGERAITGFKGNSMIFVNDKLYFCFSFGCEGGRFKTFRIVYDIEADRLTDPVLMKLNYHGKLCDLDDELINRIYEDNGYARVEEAIVEPVSMWSEYKGEYYTTMLLGCPTPNNGIVIKTRDFETAELVSVIPENENGCAEAISFIHEGRMYIACRQGWTTPYMLLMTYDVDAQIWKEPYKIEDANSRPFIFSHMNELYLYNTVDEGYRCFSNISVIRTSKLAHNGKNNPIDTVATLYGCGSYNGFAVYGDRIFFVGSKDARVHFGELKLKRFSPIDIEDKLIAMFNEGIESGNTANPSDTDIAIGAQRHS